MHFEDLHPAQIPPSCLNIKRGILQYVKIKFVDCMVFVQSPHLILCFLFLKLDWHVVKAVVRDHFQGMACSLELLDVPFDGL